MTGCMKMEYVAKQTPLPPIGGLVTLTYGYVRVELRFITATTEVKIVSRQQRINCGCCSNSFGQEQSPAITRATLSHPTDVGGDSSLNLI